MDNILALEKELWDAADRLRSGSGLTSDRYVFPVLGLIFLKYADMRFQEADKYLKEHQVITPRGPIPIEPSDYNARHALCLPQEAQFSYICELSSDQSVGLALNKAMTIIEDLRKDLAGVLHKQYHELPDDLLRELMRLFNNQKLASVKEDFIGRIYEYFVGKFAQAGASENGMFFTPASLVGLISLIVEPTHGTILDPACGSGGMFLQALRYAIDHGLPSDGFSIYGHELKDTTANLCRMNIAVHSLSANIKSGTSASTYFNDPHDLEGKCDFVMANPPFNDGPISVSAVAEAGRLPFGLPKGNDKGEIGNANYLWISYFYAYLNATGRAGFVLASSATDSGKQEAEMRQKLIQTGHVDVMVSVAGNFFYTVALPCSLWFFDKGKPAERQDKILFIDARNYYTTVSRKLNEWTIWQRRNLAAVAHVYRGETDKYKALLQQYVDYISAFRTDDDKDVFELPLLPDNLLLNTRKRIDQFKDFVGQHKNGAFDNIHDDAELLGQVIPVFKEEIKNIIERIENTKTKEEKVTLLKELGGDYKNLQIAKKTITTKADTFEKRVFEHKTVMDEFTWIFSKFGFDGEYQNIEGLCYVATLREVEEHKWSLTPGAYVGVAEVNDENEVPFAERMAEIHAELNTLHAESIELMKKINENLKEVL